MTVRRNLLLVENDFAVREALSRALAAEGFTVISAATAQEAVYGYTNHPINIAVLDLNLGDEDGSDIFHLLKTVRNDLPIIIISGETNRLQQTFVTRANGVLEKPFDFPVLLSLLERAAPAATPERQEPTYAPVISS